MVDIESYLGTEHPFGGTTVVEPVLIVEDSKVTRTIIRNLLEKLGIRDVKEVEDARSAFLELQNRDYAFILCDVEMAPISGIQFLAAVRAHPTTEHIPVILVTASRNQKHVASAKLHRADQFLLKPFSAGTLREAIEEALRSQKVNTTKDEKDTGHNSRQFVRKWIDK